MNSVNNPGVFGVNYGASNLDNLRSSLILTEAPTLQPLDKVEINTEKTRTEVCNNTAAGYGKDKNKPDQMCNKTGNNQGKSRFGDNNPTISSSFPVSDSQKLDKGFLNNPLVQNLARNFNLFLISSCLLPVFFSIHARCHEKQLLA